MMIYAEYRPLASHPQNGEGRDSDMGSEFTALITKKNQVTWKFCGRIERLRGST
jgi:hypothetical protein